MLLFPSKLSYYQYKKVKVQKSSLQLSCIRILSHFIFIRLQLWSWNFSCFTLDSDSFWKAHEKVSSNVSMLSHHTQEEKEAEGPQFFWLGRTLSQLSAVSCGLQASAGYQDAFPLKNCNFCWVPSLFHHMMLLKPRSSHFFFLPNLPFENKIIHRVTMN